MRKACYKKDSKNKIRVTFFSLEGSNIVTSSGLLDGKLKETVIPCKPKNLGKINETTGEQQAELELLSRYRKKLDEGYFSTIEEAEDEVVILPMLAKSVNLDKLVFPVIVSPKLDGMRCMGRAGEDGNSDYFKSRKGKEITTLPHISLPLVTMDGSLHLDAWFDGEMYSHKDDFQTNMSLIKKYRKGLTERVKYHVYDLYVPNTPMKYTERHSLLKKLVPIYDGSPVEVVPYFIVNSINELNSKHQEFLNNGYEGSMVRINEVPYELNKRSSSLLKYKDFIDEVYEIVDIIPNDKTPTQGTVVCRLEDTTFKCGMKMSHEEREEILSNKDDYIGELAEVRFFEYSSTGIPRFPVCHGLRF